MSETEQEKLAGVTREAVRKAMAEREEADRLSKLEELLGNAGAEVNALTAALTAKEGELASASEAQEALEAQLEELRAETEKLRVALEATSTDKEVLEERASVAEAKLADIEAEKKLTARMVELEEAKVVKSGEKRVVQEDKIRGLSDEEFTTYKGELVDFRTEWEAEKIAAAGKENTTSDKGTDLKGKGEVNVAPANLELAREEAASAAATLNIEVASEDMVSKYLSWANQMAEDMKNSQK